MYFKHVKGSQSLLFSRVPSGNALPYYMDDLRSSWTGGRVLSSLDVSSLSFMLAAATQSDVVMVTAGCMGVEGSFLPSFQLS